MIGVPVLVMLAVVALALAFTVRHRRQTGDTGPRIVVFLLGGAITQLTIYLYAALESFAPSVNLPSMLLGGIIWLLTYEVVVRARFRIEAKTFFVSGSGIQKDREILPDAYGRPIERLSPVASLRYRNNSDPRVRHYRWFRIHDWSNELIVSHFFRCARRGRTMFIEVNRYLLAPIADRYRKVDSLPAPHFRHLTLLGLVSIVAGPLAVIGAAFSLLARLTLAVERVFGTRKRNRRREIDDNPLFNYGAATPLRQAFSSDRFLHYFQKIDGDCYNKVFEREVLDAICSFLEAHHIDTSDLRERQNVIMNSGIIVQGGDVRAESLAVGSGATASKTTTNPLMQRIRQEKKA